MLKVTPSTPDRFPKPDSERGPFGGGPLAEAIAADSLPHHTILSVNLAGQHGEWEQCGIDWMKVTKRALDTQNHDFYDGRSYVILGKVEDMLPSGKRYGIAAVGSDVWPEEARRDMAYVLELQRTALSFGALIETDEQGECLFAVFELTPCVIACGVPTVSVGG